MIKKLLLSALCLLCSLGGTVTYAETLNDLQNPQIHTTKSGNSVESAVIKPQYLPEFDSETPSYKAAQSVIYKAINLILFISGITAVIVIIIGGFIYVINAGVEEMQTTAKNAILYAVIGLIAIFLSYTVVENTVRYLYDEAEPDSYEEIDTLPQTDVVKGR